jgi:hypothetical protein
MIHLDFQPSTQLIVNMTSRIKHKLELENVNLKSAHLNESFVKVGSIGSVGL